MEGSNRMDMDHYIQFFSLYIISILLLVFVRHNKVREAYVIFFFKQFMTWIFGLVIAQYALIEYPVRFFPYATRASFTFEYFGYPALCVLFNLYYPPRGWLKITLYYIAYCSAITFYELLLERYTNLIAYIHWEWYWTWLTLAFTF
jgi:predicted neutral ceramidase superfamily lipid hydrolase